MRLSVVLRLTVAALALAALAGCGAEAGGEASDEAERDEARLAFARCMRAEGLDVPDPPAGERGFEFARSEDPSLDEAFERARNDCRKKLVGTYEFLEEDKAGLNDKVVLWARCMRREGIDIADPVFTATYGKGQFFREVGHPQDPVWNKADDKCRTEIFGGPDQGPGGERTQEGDDPS